MPRVLATQDSDGHWWPYLKIRLKSAAKTVEITSAILDSGADETSIPASLLPVLGITRAKLRPQGQMMGATGSAPYFRADVQVWWKRWKICDEIGVIETDASVLIGRDDFFTRFIVKFNWSKLPPIMDIDPAARPR